MPAKARCTSSTAPSHITTGHPGWGDCGVREAAQRGLWPAGSTSSTWTSRISASGGWVILPTQVNYCTGQHVHPLGHRISTSNYTSFMSFLSHCKVNPAISRPSCVSNKLNAVSSLYCNEQKTPHHGGVQAYWWRIVVASEAGMGGSSSWGLTLA